MKLIMAISKDGYIAKGVDDDMAWLGRTDKALFRLLTVTHGGRCVVSSRTARAMPESLPGRSLVVTSRDGQDLATVAGKYPDAWLLGGQELALAALDLGYVTEAHLFRSPVAIGAGIADRLTDRLLNDRWRIAATVDIDKISVSCWRPPV